jgi:hypothetical protein
MVYLHSGVSCIVNILAYGVVIIEPNIYDEGCHFFGIFEITAGSSPILFITSHSTHTDTHHHPKITANNTNLIETFVTKIT